jgi:hypothetical protein
VAADTNIAWQMRLGISRVMRSGPSAERRTNAAHDLRVGCVSYIDTCISIQYLYNAAMPATRKPLHFMGSSHSDLKAFPQEARRDAGFNLDFVQRGSNLKIGSR